MISLKNILESMNPNVYKVQGKLVVNTEERSLTDILSDIRAIPGITIVTTRNIEDDPDPKTKRHVVTLSLKIDPAPFKPFSKDSFKKILLQIKHVPSVLTAKFTSNPTTI
jgi:hypothetical protein